MNIAVEEAPDIDVERTEWTPSAAQFARYLRREIELASSNIRGLLFEVKVDRANGRTPRFNTFDLLHSKQTLFAGMQRL